MATFHVVLLLAATTFGAIWANEGAGKIITDSLKPQSVTLVSKDITLKCTLDTKEEYDKVSWKFTEKNPTKQNAEDGKICERSKDVNEDGCTDESKYSLDNTAKENLLIKSITTEDAGTYICSVTKEGATNLSPQLNPSSAIPKSSKLKDYATDKDNEKTGELAVIGNFKCNEIKGATVNEAVFIDCSMDFKGNKGKVTPKMTCTASMGDDTLESKCPAKKWMPPQHAVDSDEMVRADQLCITSDKIGTVEVECLAGFAEGVEVLPLGSEIKLEFNYEVTAAKDPVTTESVPSGTLTSPTESSAWHLRSFWLLLVVSLLLACQH